MQTFGYASATLATVPMTTDEAICAEFAARIQQFGGLRPYSRAFGEDQRNTALYMRGKVPTLPTLLRHLEHLDVSLGEFFSAVQARLDQP